MSPVGEGHDKPASILVVDDVAENIDVVSGILKQEYKIRAAINGKRALEIAASDKPPDLILLDIMMPEMDGLEVCRQLKQKAETRDIPVIFLTARGRTSDVVTGLGLGAVDYVTKPANPAILKARVDSHVTLKKTRDALRQQLKIIEENSRLKEDVERITRHDLKNPLGIILGYASMLHEDESLAEEQRESAALMEEAAWTMLEMINRSLDLFRIEKDSYQLSPVPVDLNRLMWKVKKEHERLASRRKVAIVICLDGEVSIVGEEMLCHSLFGNLVKNALEASPPGSEVRIESRRHEDRICLNIHNDGVIADALRDTFFDKYATHGKKQGTGIGTYSAMMMARVQNGTLEFTSSEEQGTTLIACLPAQT